MKELICITCPKGCRLTVDDTVCPIKVDGAGCKRGIVYANTEVNDPRRMVTTTVKVFGGSSCRVAVKTQSAIPKPLIFDVMNELNKVEVSSPINIGQTIVENILDTGISVVATSNCR